MGMTALLPLTAAHLVDIVSSGIAVLLGVVVAMSVILVGLRAITSRSRSKKDEMRRQIRPLVGDLLTSDQGPQEVLYQLEHLVPSRERKILDEVLVEHARLVKGSEMELLTYVFENMGYVDEDIRGLQHGGSIKRAEAAFHLGTMSSERSAPYLIKALGSSNTDVAFASLNALSHIGTPEAVDGVMRLLSSGNRPQNVRIAEVVLERKRAFAPLIRQHLDATPGDLEWLRLLIDLAGAMRDSQSVPALLRYLEHPDSSIRAAAARALGSIDDGSACPALSSALEDGSGLVRSEAATALGRMQYEPSIPGLREGLHDDDLQVKMSCAIALTKMGERGYSALRSGLSATEEREREVVAEVLGTGEVRRARAPEAGRA